MSSHSIIIDSTHVTNDNHFADKLHNVDFNSPAKIFQNKLAIHQFENVTPDRSMPGTPLLTPNHRHSKYDSDTSSVGYPSPSLPPTAVHTPPSLSPQNSGDESSTNKKANSLKPPSSDSSSLESKGISHSASATSLPVRPTTPSQFVFKRPQYNKEYHQNHFHHLEKKDSVFKDFKNLFKSDKKKAKTPSVKSGSELSFANEFNRDLEGKYGKWGKLFFH
jgi:hypothetical protein